MYSENKSKRSIPLKDISTGHFSAKLTEPCVILRLLNLKVESEGFILAVRKRTREIVDC